MIGTYGVQTLKTQIDGFLKIWEKVRIFVGDDSNAGEYDARIEDFINGGIVITEPVFIQGGTLLREGVSVRVTFTQKDAAYQFYADIKHRSVKGSRKMLLTPPKSIQRVQRRSFVRIETLSRVAYAKVASRLTRDDWEDHLTWSDSSCVDISGGGTLIRSNEEMPGKSLLLLRLEFFKRSGLPETVVGIVRRTIVRNDECFAGLEFVLAHRLQDYFDSRTLKRLPEAAKRFDATAQNKLVSTIFAEQIKLRRKGLL